MTELEGIAEHFPRRASGATRPKDSATPAATPAVSEAESPAEAESAVEAADETSLGEASQVEAPADGSSSDEATLAASQPAAAATESSADETSLVEASQVEVTAIESSAVEVETALVEGSQIEAPATETMDADALQVEPTFDAAPAETSSEQDAAIEASPVEVTPDASPSEPASDESLELAVESTPVEALPAGPTEALARLLDPESRDIEDARALQTTFDGEAQRSFVARAQVLGANAWRAVDLGSGLGDIALAMARALPGLHLIAIESSATLLRLACRKRGVMHGNVVFLRGDARATGLPEHSCDLVLAHDVVHHLTDPLALFLEVARVAREDAAIYVRDLRRPETAEALERAVEDQTLEWSERQRRQLHAAMHAALAVEEVRALCDAAGLCDVEVRACGELHWEVVRARRRGD